MFYPSWYYVHKCLIKELGVTYVTVTYVTQLFFPRRIFSFCARVKIFFFKLKVWAVCILSTILNVRTIMANVNYMWFIVFFQPFFGILPSLATQNQIVWSESDWIQHILKPSMHIVTLSISLRIKWLFMQRPINKV